MKSARTWIHYEHGFSKRDLHMTVFRHDHMGADSRAVGFHFSANWCTARSGFGYVPAANVRSTMDPLGR